jgi:spermidine/putrescine transport system ATP-binding protein
MANNKRFIVLQNVAKRYGEGSLAVEKINLSIEKGSFVTLLGPSGCGKTTILKMLGGFETTTSGRILVNGIDTKNLAVNERETATVFQDYALFPNMNVYKNITYGLKVVRVPLDGTPAKVKREAIKVYENAKKEAEKKIIGLRKDLVKIQIQIDKTHELYRKYPQSYAIRKMRWSIYKLRLSKLFEKGSKDDKKFIKRLSLKNKIVEVSNA